MAVATDTDTRISAAAVVAAAKQAGFTGVGLLTAVAVSFAEDGSHDVAAVNHNSNGTVDRGLWQINSVHSEFDANSLLSDPVYNAKAAYQISNKGTDFTPWTTFNNGAAQAQIGNAEQATGISDGGGATDQAGPTLPGQKTENLWQAFEHEAEGEIPGLSTAETLAGFFAKLTDPAFWKRIGLGVVGVILIGIALIVLLRRPAEAVAKAAPKVIPV